MSDERDDLRARINRLEQRLGGSSADEVSRKLSQAAAVRRELEHRAPERNELATRIAAIARDKNLVVEWRARTIHDMGSPSVACGCYCGCTCGCHCYA